MRLYDKILLCFLKLIFPDLSSGEFDPPRRHRHGAITREGDSRLRRDYAIARSSGIGIPITCARVINDNVAETSAACAESAKKPAVDVVPDPPLSSAA